MTLKDRLVAAYRSEPAIINAGAGLLAAVATKYGFDIEEDWIMLVLFGVVAAVTRETVVAPDTADRRVQVAVVKTEQLVTEQVTRDVKRAFDIDPAAPLPDSAGHEPVRPPDETGHP